MSNHETLPKGFVQCSCGDNCRRRDDNGPATEHRHNHDKKGPLFFYQVTGNEDKQNLPENPKVICRTCMLDLRKSDPIAEFVSMSEYDRTRLSAKFASLLDEKKILVDRIAELEREKVRMNDRFQFLTGHRNKPQTRRRDPIPRITEVSPAPETKQAATA